MCSDQNAILNTYLLTPQRTVLLQKLLGFQLFKKLPAFYGTRKFIDTYTSYGHLSVSWARSIQSMPPSHFLWIHLNIALPSMPGSSKWSLSLRFPHHLPCIRLPSSLYALHAPPISFFSILSPEQYWAKSTDHLVPHYVFFSTPLLPLLLRPNYSPQHLFSNTLSLRTKTPYILLYERIFKQFFVRKVSRT